MRAENTEAERVVPPQAPLSEYLSYCKDSFATARAGGYRFVRVSVVAPIVPLFSDVPSSVLWCPPQGSQQVGSGHIVTVVGEGPERFEKIKAGADAIWADLCDIPHSTATPEEPRLLGGLSFAETPPSQEWEQFGQGKFWLPRFLYERTDSKNLDQQAWVSLCCNTTESPTSVARELHDGVKRLACTNRSTLAQASISETEHLPMPTWNCRIESIRNAISDGSVHKIVAARSSRLHFREAIKLRPALETLSKHYLDCYQYAFSLGSSTFLGASPETLIDKHQQQVYTQALAGSIAADHFNAGATLLGRKKDRLEQNLVVRAITAALEPLCSSLHIPDIPRTLTLRHLTHLCTPISGRLHVNQHVLDLVKALHPTPAVGGVPSDRAMRWIRENERDRGWYAGPVGWFNAAGDGHFAVAIRSALFCGSDALVFAGAGIVQDSNPELEYQETGLKQRAILDALGIR